MPKINGEPNYSNINTRMQLLYGNAASLPTTLGGGQHGHLGIIMTPKLYTTLANTRYESPLDPGITLLMRLDLRRKSARRTSLFINMKREYSTIIKR